MRANYAAFNGSCLPKPSLWPGLLQLEANRTKLNTFHIRTHTHTAVECVRMRVCVPGQVCLTALNKNNPNDELSAEK